MKDLIGRKVKGFKFSKKDYICGYCESMDINIDQIGEIYYYNEFMNAFEVNFDTTEFSRYLYPAELIEQHLID